MEFLKSKWPRAFMLTTAIQAIICLAFEAYTFARFQVSVGSNEGSNVPQYKTIPTFLTLFIFGFIYELVLVWDALRMKNTIQVMFVCAANLALLVFTAIQIDQINEAIVVLTGDPGALKAINLSSEIRPFLVAIPAIVALGTLLMIFIAWKLYREFAWDILKHIGADYRMKKRFLYYQIYIALLKFDFFFFLGFTVQFLVIVTAVKDVEFPLTICAVPITILILVLASFFTRRENKFGMAAIIVLFFCGLAYFFFKLVRIYQPDHAKDYMPVRRSLTAFAVVTILLIILTIINAFICMSNFGAGLKRHLIGAAVRDEEKPDPNAYAMSDLNKPQLPSRMTID